jgi:uncharacterized protein (TIGR02147 family)
MRAFARDLGLSPSRLCQVLKGKQGLSKAAAVSICHKLGFTPEETHHFTCLVDASDARSKKDRARAEAALAELVQSQVQFKTLPEDAFQVISEWHYYALKELLRTNNFKYDTDWIAKRLGISRYEVEVAIEKLQKLGFVRVLGDRMESTETATTTTHNVPSRALRLFHKSILNKAIDAIDFQAVNERDITSLTIPVAKRDLPIYQEEIKKFRRQFCSLAEARPPGEKDEVYNLSVQFFRLTEKEDAQ